MLIFADMKQVERESPKIESTIDERALRVALDFLSLKQCLADDSKVFERHDFASRSLANFLTG